MRQIPNYLVIGSGRLAKHLAHYFQLCKIKFHNCCSRMVINNTIVLYALWLMLFAGKSHNQEFFPYVLALLGLVNTSWGVINFCSGGLKNLAINIENGSFETYLGIPRHPLILTAISASNPIAFGDIIQGIINVIIAGFLTDYVMVIKMIISLITVLIAFVAVFKLQNLLVL